MNWVLCPKKCTWKMVKFIGGVLHKVLFLAEDYGIRFGTKRSFVPVGINIAHFVGDLHRCQQRTLFRSRNTLMKSLKISKVCFGGRFRKKAGIQFKPRQFQHWLKSVSSKQFLAVGPFKHEEWEKEMDCERRCGRIVTIKAVVDLTFRARLIRLKGNHISQAPRGIR